MEGYSMRIRLKVIRDLGYEVAINEDDTIDIYGKGYDEKVGTHVKRVSERLGFNNRETDDLVQSINDIGVMSALRKAGD
jgi:hypothetical protein